MGSLVSVIIPTYNSEDVICDAIDCALAQTYNNIEVIVVDDGSSDATAEVLNRKYPTQIRYIVKPNGGPASARNLGIRNSGGEFLAFLDADDLWEPTKVEEQVKLFSSGTVVVGCALESTNDGSTKQLSFDELVVVNNLPNSGVMTRRSAVEEVGMLDEGSDFKAVEDWELLLRLAKVGDIIMVNRDLVVLRVMENSLSAPARAGAMLENEINVLKRHLADRPIFRSQAMSERYYSAAWAFSTRNESKEARRSMMRCMMLNPLGVFDRHRMGLLLKILKNSFGKQSAA